MRFLFIAAASGTHRSRRKWAPLIAVNIPPPSAALNRLLSPGHDGSYYFRKFSPSSA